MKTYVPEIVLGTYVSLISQTYEIGTTITPTVEMKKLRYREIKYPLLHVQR